MKHAPKDLSKESAKFWNDTLKIYELQPHHEKILEAACGEWDIVIESEAAIRREGVYLKDRFGQVKPHPAIQVKQKSKNLFRLLLRELGLDLQSPEDSRPPRQY
ncbi:MAG: P27 family phage terminase small subunit [Desulfobacterales bacterium]|nr:P27 family phage terminase small subunit [Desulfobacterales bacterium]